MSRSLSLGALALGLSLAAAPAQAQSLRGSPASVNHMYRQALRHDLPFLESAVGVRRAVREGTLVRLAGNSSYRVGAVTHPYVLPSTHRFVLDLAARYRDRCGERMVVTSGVRPLSMRLSNSVDKSVHPTGMAVDLRKPRSARCLAWLRGALRQMEIEGRIEATEEHRPPHFHVAVFPSRLPASATRLADAGKTSSRPASARAGSTASRSKAKPATKVAHSSAGGRTHKVRRGESIWTIARRNRVSVEQIKSANRLSSSRILAGQLLVIPRAE